MDGTILEDFNPYQGQHCETTTVGSLLRRVGVELSEPMLFGIGEGLGFVFWRMKTMDFPFIGGRIKTDRLSENICRNLHLELEVKETSSIKKAWSNVENALLNNIPVGLKLDCYHLDYFTNKIHFAGHYAAIYGFDEEYAYMNDTLPQGCAVRTSLKKLALARNEKGPMASRNLSFTIQKNEKLPDLEKVIKKAILKNANDFLNPPIKNMGYKGIMKTAEEVMKWFSQSKNIKSEFKTSAMLMEHAGTGGALFRNLYRDFLKQSYDLTGIKALKQAYRDYKGHAANWTKVSELFVKIAETEDEKYLVWVSEMLLHLSEGEKRTMEELKKAIENL